ALLATKTVGVKTDKGEIQLKTDEPDVRLQLEGFDRAERLYGVTLTKHEVPPPARGNLTVVMVRASDLDKAQQRAERKPVEINPVERKPIPVTIVKRETK